MAKNSEAPTAVGQLSYEEAVSELEHIVTDLDQGVINVDTLSQQFQRAIDIVEELDGRISKTRAKVDQLAPRLEGIGGGATQINNDETAF